MVTQELYPKLQLKNPKWISETNIQMEK